MTTAAGAPRVCLVIPALDESATIAQVVERAKAFGTPVVVDDGSRDGTGNLAARAGADVVRHDVNRGYDGALESGFARASALGCAYVITMDADGQHDPTIVDAFVRALDAGADVVVGVRDRRQRLGEHLFAWIAARRWGVHDPLCGMKGYRTDVYREVGWFDSYRSIGTELALRAASRGRRIAEVPVHTRARRGASRFGAGLDANRRILRALVLALRLPRQRRAA